MTTITVDILDDKALNLLKGMEALKIIRIQDNNGKPQLSPTDFVAKYSGAMSKQSPEEIDKQLDDLRNESD
ncbi:MAG TPA: hypothetical protein VGN20_15625 [Mucilaginibacter sp.]|jgi:hypothetical protein